MTTVTAANLPRNPFAVHRWLFPDTVDSFAMEYLMFSPGWTNTRVFSRQDLWAVVRLQRAFRFRHFLAWCRWQYHLRNKRLIRLTVVLMNNLHPLAPRIMEYLTEPPLQVFDRLPAEELARRQQRWTTLPLKIVLGIRSTQPGFDDDDGGVEAVLFIGKSRIRNPRNVARGRNSRITSNRCALVFIPRHLFAVSYPVFVSPSIQLAISAARYRARPQ